MAKRRRPGLGDGDDCPVVATHGAMHVIPGNKRQYCPDQSHDGPFLPDKRPATRSFWPFGWRSFEAEVAEYNGSTTKAAAELSALPELNITLEV